jgi:Transcriptional regulator/sugar kinase
MEFQRSLIVPQAANANLQNNINVSIIFNYIRARGDAYRARIARDLNMSAPAVSRAIERLICEGYLVESERVLAESGKKAARVSVNAARGLIVGIDILAEPIEIAISDFAGTLLYSAKGPRLEGEEEFSSFLEKVVDDALAGNRRLGGGEAKRVLAICVGVPAAVDPSSGLLNVSLYPTIVTSDFRKRLADRFGADVFIENTANLAAIGEWKRGAGEGAKSLLFVAIGNGIGAGLILDGNLYRGTHGSAGEIGYLLTHPEALDYAGAKRGFLETKSSLGALREMGLGGDGSLRAACLAAEAGDAMALAALREAVEHLAVALLDCMILLDPELVILGGGAVEDTEAEDFIARPLIERVSGSFPFGLAPVRLTSLGSRASVLGALQFGLDSLIVQAFPYRL